MKTVVYPGTFDPITLGHVAMIRRAASMFERVIIGVSAGHEKQRLFNDEERLALVVQAVAELDNVEVELFEGLAVEFVKQRQADAIVRGLRSSADFELEYQLANMNKAMTGVETILLFASEYNYVSSSIVKEVAKLGGDVREFVTEDVAVALKSKLEV